MANSVDPDQTAPIGAVCFGSTLFVCMLKFASKVRQLFAVTTSAAGIFRCILLDALRVKIFGGQHFSSGLCISQLSTGKQGIN